MNIGIYIPSYCRVDNQKTLESIPEKLLDKTYLVVYKSDYLKYRKRYGKRVNVLLCPVEGIAKTRQWILENCNEKYAFMIDDDMAFQYRDRDMKMHKCKDKNFINMINLLEDWLDEDIVHVGVSHAFGNNRVKDDYIEIGRMNNAYAYNCLKMKIIKDKHNIGFDSFENKYNKRLVMEDFYLTLSLLKWGYKNRITYKYTWSQKQSGAEGGCSLYRNSEMQKESANLLAKEFPELVVVKTKKSSKKWSGFDSEIRTDVNILWKKCYKNRRNKVGISNILNGV